MPRNAIIRPNKPVTYEEVDRAPNPEAQSQKAQRLNRRNNRELQDGYVETVASLVKNKTHAEQLAVWDGMTPIEKDQFMGFLFCKWANELR